MNSIILREISVTDRNLVKYEYEVLGDWSSCFSAQRSTFIEYDMDISDAPLSVLAVPFVCNVLPAIWLCDAILEVDTLDSFFMDHIKEIKNGYMNMYPMLTFKGHINTSVQKNEPLKHTNESACFFSGGVDAHTSFFRHINEKPALLTVWGSDIKLNDITGWNTVRSYIENFAEENGVKCLSIKSDFRSVILEGELDKIVVESKDHWWHGFQNSISIISLAAPLSYVFGWKKLYLASSFSKDIEGEFAGSSIPSIDDNVCFCGCHTCHDGYEINRQQKLHYLTQLPNRIQLRVCWESSGGSNCSSCEKCYRTILGLVAEGVDPNDYGFIWNQTSIEKCRNDFAKKIEIDEYFYHPIQKRMIENSANISEINGYKWFMELDLAEVNNSYSKKLKKAIQKIKRRLYKVIKGI